MCVFNTSSAVFLTNGLNEQFIAAKVTRIVRQCKAVLKQQIREM